MSRAVSRRDRLRKGETMKTPQEYIESLRKLNLVVYLFGKRIENVVDDPIIRRPSMRWL
jgi:aromatic ring hydroxylase